MNVNWEGVYPALTTKFTADGQLDLVLFEKTLGNWLLSKIRIFIYFFRKNFLII